MTAQDPPVSDPLPSDVENAGGGVRTTEGAPFTEGRRRGGVGGRTGDQETRLTILRGNDMEWFYDRSSGTWYVTYGLPSSDHKMLFESSPEQMDALFGTNQRPVDFSFRRLEHLTRRDGVHFSGNIAEMEGEGRFEDEVRRVKALAFDSGDLPEWAKKTGEMMDIIFIAEAEGKSDAWALDQIARTNSFKERFPNIEHIKNSGNLTLSDAITGFLEFEAGMRSASKAIGSNPARVTPEVVGGMLKKGHTLNTITNAAMKFGRMKDYRPALNAFNRVLASQGMDTITTLQQMYDFVAGKAPDEVYQVWEASSVSEAAASSGLGDVFTAEDAMKFAVETEDQTSLADATNLFQEAAQLLLRLRHEVDVGKFDLDQDEIIDLSLGRAPRSGKSAADITERMNRAILSAQASLQSSSAPFRGFDPEGRAQSASLSGLRQ